ncbi:hypothetical protein J2T13_002362 [Paenibacillus sp. DS2015]|uniref:hypothetical protein n=1 Tax=Paenibacillus sp. DS2015 TaxID=3373917 RepID=UPI003D1CA023
MMKFIKLCVILSSVALISCSKNEKQDIVSPTPAVTIEGINQTETVKETEIHKIKLIDDLNYKVDEKILVLHKKEYPSKFVQIELEPFGFYVPDIMKVFTYEDGSKIGFSDAEFIYLTMVDRLGNPQNIHESIGGGGDKLFRDDELSKYDEYVGSTIDSAVRTDAFLVNHDKAPDTVIIFRYFNKNIKEVLPTFLEVAKNIKYMPEE